MHINVCGHTIYGRMHVYQDFICNYAYFKVPIISEYLVYFEVSKCSHSKNHNRTGILD